MALSSLKALAYNILIETEESIVQDVEIPELPHTYYVINFKSRAFQLQPVSASAPTINIRR